jgi:Domain of unknown function (DUF4350)
MSAQGAFSARTMAVLVLVAVFAASVFVTLASFAPEWNSGQDGRAHALSRSATGYAAIVQLARATGEAAMVSRRVDPKLSFVVLTPEAPIALDEIDRRAWGAALIVLPKWYAAPDPAHRGWVTLAGMAKPEYLVQVLDEAAPKARLTRSEGQACVQLRFLGESAANAPLTTGPITGLQTLIGDDLEPVVVTADRRVIVARTPPRKDGPDIYVLSDPDFLNTQGVANADTARAALAMLDFLRHADTPLVFDVTLNGFENTRSLMRMALSPPLLAATLCLVAVAGLLGWRAAVRNGPAVAPERAIALGKRALAENAAALIGNSGRAPRMGWAYAQINGAKAAERYAPARGEREDLVPFLDRMGARRGASEKYSDLAAEASAAETRAQLLAAAQKLHAWMKEMLRASV